MTQLKVPRNSLGKSLVPLHFTSVFEIIWLWSCLMVSCVCCLHSSNDSEQVECIQGTVWAEPFLEVTPRGQLSSGRA